MTRESTPVAYCWLLNDALGEADEPLLVSNEAHDFYKSGLGWQDALILKLCGAEQSAPHDLTEAFDRTFGKA